jgi:hypothetical protein
MAHGVTLTLREIQPELSVTRSAEYKKLCCWPDGGCVTGVSDRATRRNKRFKRGRFAFLKKVTTDDQSVRRVSE